MNMFSSCSSSTPSIIKGAYYPCWSQFPPSSINTNLFTHIYYASLTPSILAFDFDVQKTQARSLVNFTSTLRAATPPVQTLVSINGNRYFFGDSCLFARMASDPSSRATFIRSGMQVAREFRFDGIDLNLSYPQNQAEMENLGIFLVELRAEVQKEAGVTGRPPLLLTAAVYYTVVISGATVRAYPTDSIARNLDWINLMNYDYTGLWDRPWATGAHAALFNPRSSVSTSHGFQEWIQAGVPRSKLVMGLPLHGRTWKLKDPSGSRGIGAPAVGVGPGNGSQGEVSYAGVVKFNEEHKAEVVYDSETVSVYSVAGSSWVGYDDTRSVGVKIDYAKRLGLRGYFFWTVIGDNNWEISERASQLWSDYTSRYRRASVTCSCRTTKPTRGDLLPEPYIPQPPPASPSDSSAGSGWGEPMGSGKKPFPWTRFCRVQRLSLHRAAPVSSAGSVSSTGTTPTRTHSSRRGNARRRSISAETFRVLDPAAHSSGRIPTRFPPE